MDDVAAWFLALYKATGIKLTIFYDGYDRAGFFEGLVAPVKLSAYCLVLSLCLGALAAWFAGSRVAIVRRAVTGFVALFRNTPPLVQLYFFYFALGPLLPRVGGAPMLGSFGWAVVSLTLLETAFAAEIYRAGIEAVPKAMVEAAATLGYAIAVPELVYMSAQIWSEQVNVPEMMVVLLICYVAIVGLINQGMQWLENRLRVPGFGQ